MDRKVTKATEMLKAARLKKGYSQQQVASIIGVHVRQYQRIECGERDIRYASMKLGLSICTVLGIDPLALVFGGEFQLVSFSDEENFPDTTARALLE